VRGEAAAVILPRDTFACGAAAVAPALLGCVLEHDTPEGLVAVALTEVEAYHGRADPASHAYRGPTPRNAVMFGPPGHAYVYFTYGMHFCVNLVCLPEGAASAVLLRAGRVIEGEDLARARRTAPGPGGRDLARGPARLCQALAITRVQNGADVCDPASPLRVRWPSPAEAGAGPPGPAGLAGAGAAGSAGPDPAGLARAGPPGPAGSAGAGPPELAGARPVGPAEQAGGSISHGPRVGVSAAGDVPWRFWVTGDPTVSVYRAYAPRRARPKPGSARARSDGTIPL
jgi:DNA-3-methyladenine glycosylase